MAAKPKANRPGGYAQARYERGLSNYRRRARPIFAVIFGPFILAGFAFLIKDGHPYAWGAGAITGAFATVWIALRDEPPAYIENWRAGAEGERKTAKALRPLQRSGLRVLHDVQARYGNYDHVAVGRAGVFLLETKNPKGVVELRNGVPHMRRRLDPDADTRLDSIRPRALAAAVRLKNDIEHRTGHRAWVQAVVVFWSDFPEGLLDDGQCIFIHGPQLRAWMQSLHDRLDRVKAEEIGAAIAAIANHEPAEERAD
jgi:hypothetical protein